MQSPYTNVCIVTGQKYITNCDIYRFNNSILLSLHTICRFRLRGLSFSHEHEIRILFTHLSSRRCSKGWRFKIIQCHRTNPNLFHKYRFTNWVYFVYVSHFIITHTLTLFNLSWHCMHITPSQNVLVTDGFLQNFIRASYHYRPHNLFACCLPITKIVTWGQWKLARCQQVSPFRRPQRPLGRVEV